MNARLVVAALTALVIASSLQGAGAPPGRAQERSFTLEAVAVACDAVEDGVCLAYDGQVPGPTLDVNLGDTVTVTLVNRIAETAAALDVPQHVKDDIAQSGVSFHPHGVAILSAMDGIHAEPGTQLVDSYAPPGGSFTSTFRAAFAGTWHYHDHVLGADGHEGTHRGLGGSLIVRSGGEPRAQSILDLHLHDEGPLGGGPAGAPVAAGERFDFVVVGLGNWIWQVELLGPDGSLAGKTEVGPGMSERFHVPSAKPGAYTWRATSLVATHQGEVVVS